MPKYAKPGGPESFMSRPAALMHDEFFQIQFTHLATGQSISFDGWVTQFSDQFNSSWNAETVYGRMDPMATFQGTQRQIALGFDIVSGAHQEAEMNLAKVNRLIEFLYPVYESADRNSQNALQAAPLIGLRWTNLAAGARAGQRLVGYLDGVTYAPDVAQGGFMGSSQGTTSEEVSRQRLFGGMGLASQTDAGEKAYSVTRKLHFGKSYIPKVLSLSLNYNVMHTHLMGWAKEGGTYKFGGNDDVDRKFPNNHSQHFTSTERVQIIENAEGDLVAEAKVHSSAATAANENDVLGNL